MMKYLLLVIGVAMLSGCVQDDPWRTTLANERAVTAANSQAVTASNIERAQQADTDTRNAQAMLQALQAQQAIVAAQAASAQAQSQTAIVASNNAALVMVADQIAQASKPDYTPVYVVIAGIVIIIVVWVVVNGRKPSRQPIAMPTPLLAPNGTEAWLMPDGTVRWRRLSDGRVKVLLPEHEMYSRLLSG